MIYSNQEFRWIELKTLKDLNIELVITTILEYSDMYWIYLDSIICLQTLSILFYGTSL
jgi:hypothetical protein